MRTIRRSAYAVAVSVTVFGLLALPVFSRLFGPWVYLPIYLIVALLAGSVVWSLLGWRSDDSRGYDAVTGRAADQVKTADEQQPTPPDPDIDVEQELEDIKNQE